MNRVPSDAPSIFEVLKTLTSLERQAIVRPNNPPPGVAGFLFDIVGDDLTELESDITDHFVEDNTSIEDQIALRPERITVQGVVAELFTTPPSTTRVVSPADPLPNNVTLEPTLTPGAQQTQDQAQAAADARAATVVNTQSLYDYFSARSPQEPNQTRQSKAFAYFYQLWKGRQLFSVETPYGVWDNMAILTMRAKQSEETRFVSDFAVTFKKIRIATTVSVNLGQLAGRLFSQKSEVSQNGNAGTKQLTNADKESILFQLGKKLVTP